MQDFIFWGLGILIFLGLIFFTLRQRKNSKKNKDKDAIKDNYTMW